MNARSRPYTLAVILMVGAVAALAIDVPVARYSLRDWMIGDLRKLLDISEVFAHGFGVILILTTIFVLDPLSRWRLPRVIACTFSAGLLAQLSKHLVPRIRPNVFDLSEGVMNSFVVSGAPSSAEFGQLSGRALQSLPSGHTATAVGLAFALAALYPRGRWLFATFAMLAAAQRVECSAHFVSDTLVGAAIGCVVAGLLLDNRLLGRPFHRLESRAVAADAGCGKAGAGVSPRQTSRRSNAA